MSQKAEASRQTSTETEKYDLTIFQSPG